jgi:hypothetical protein
MLWTVGLAALALLFFWFVHWARRYQQRIDAVWATAAQGLGAQFNRRFGPWYHRVRRIDARVEGVDVAVDHYTVSTGKSSQTFTRLQADVVFPGKLRLRVFPKHALSGLSKALGFQDVATGDADFDERFVVKANDEAMARSWLTPRVRQAIARAAKYSFSIKDGKLSAQRSGLETDADVLQAAVRATAEVAGSGSRLLARWERFARVEEGVLGAGQGRPRIELDERGVPLRIDTADDGSDGGTVTRVRARVMDPDAERYELRQDAGYSDPTLIEMADATAELPGRFAVASSEPAQTARRIDDGVKRNLAVLAPLRIESDGEEVTVVLPGMESDEARLREAVEVATALAAESPKGPYR